MAGRTRLWSINTQLVALVGAVALPLIVATAWLGTQAYEAHRDAHGRSLLQIARGVSSATDRDVALLRSELEWLATSPLLDEGRFAEFRELAARAVSGGPGTGIVLWDRNGQLANTLRPPGSKLPTAAMIRASERIAAADEVATGTWATIEGVFASAQPAYSDLFVGIAAGKPILTVDVPVIREGVVRYVLSYSLDIDIFNRIFAEQRLAGEYRGALVDRRGFSIARTAAPERVGKPVTPRLRASIARDREAIGEGVAPGGVAVLNAFTHSAVTGWTTVVSIAREHAFAPFWRSMLQWSLVAAVLVLIAIAAALHLARRIADPLHALARAVEDGAALPPDVDITTRELRGLADSLDESRSAATQRDAEQALRIAAEVRSRQAEAASRAKDEFLAALGHEIRNPLAAIAAGVALLERARIDDSRARFAVPMLSRQLQQLRRLVDDMLDLARITHGKLSVDVRPVELRETAEHVVERYRNRSQAGPAIEIGGGPQWARADPARLEQMIANLVDNALKYGGPRIVVTVGRDGPFATLAVRDSGPGIAPELRERLFRPFEQGEQGLDRRHGGLGLGLSLVARLCELQGGDISVEDNGDERGATFRFRLPVADPDVAATPASEAVPSRSFRVLVVEDQPDVRESLSMLLELEGHSVACVPNGPAALEALAAQRFDVALVDIGLPGMDGYEVARRIRTQPHGREMLLAALSGYGYANDVRRCMEAGFDRHLTKPATLDELHALFDTLRTPNAA